MAAASAAAASPHTAFWPNVFMASVFAGVCAGACEREHIGEPVTESTSPDTLPLSDEAHPADSTDKTIVTQTAYQRLHRPALELLAVSFVVLFQELVLIRWLPVEVRVTAYFPNLILLSAFLGLGVGALRSRGASLLWLWPVSLDVEEARWAFERYPHLIVALQEASRG